MLTAERMRQLLHYDPELGWFMWTMDMSSKCLAGSIAGTVDAYGYHVIHIGGRQYKAHRLAWLWVTGRWPRLGIDHRDTNKSNNEWGNLREATVGENVQNARRARRNNRSGLLGVAPNRKRWSASITTGGRRQHLGTFDSPELAHAAYLAAKRQQHEGAMQ